MWETLNEMQAEETTRRQVRRAVATCLVCGGTYRPEGGPCIHEHPRDMEGVAKESMFAGRVLARVFRVVTGSTSYRVTCGDCKREWQPGHTCLVARQSTPGEEATLWARFAPFKDEVNRLLHEEPDALAPENWE